MQLRIDIALFPQESLLHSQSCVVLDAFLTLLMLFWWRVVLFLFSYRRNRLVSTQRIRTWRRPRTWRTTSSGSTAWATWSPLRSAWWVRGGRGVLQVFNIFSGWWTWLLLVDWNDGYRCDIVNNMDMVGVATCELCATLWWSWFRFVTKNRPARGTTSLLLVREFLGPKARYGLYPQNLRTFWIVITANWYIATLREIHMDMKSDEPLHFKRQSDMSQSSPRQDN